METKLPSITILPRTKRLILRESLQSQSEFLGLKVLRLPAVSGRFYPSDPLELEQLVRRFLKPNSGKPPIQARACLVPHAGYIYSGHVAGAVFAKVELPQTIIVLGVRHRPPGASAAILSSGSWRTPLGDVSIDTRLASTLKKACPLFREDDVAHSVEHSLEVQLPFLQVLIPELSFVPIALGTIHFESLVEIGNAIGQVIQAATDSVLLVTTSDLNHYENDTITRAKDELAVEKLLALDPYGLFDVCMKEDISMCGLGPAISMLTAVKALGGSTAELVRHATSADISGDRETVVGYAGLIYP
jgi:AmmeMemoRadiSam system protein B